MSFCFDKNYWGIVLGGSSGYGLATAKKLASHGMNICVVHRDRRGAMERIEQEFAEIRSQAPHFLSFNLDAASQEGRKQVLDRLLEEMGDKGRVRLLLHSIAFGNLKMIAPSKDHPDQPLISEEDLGQTIQIMSTSLLSWTQDLFLRGMFAADARVLGLSSEGNKMVLKGYAAVSAAKVTLEAIIRYIAVEYGPFGIRANSIQAGIADTPAQRSIPGSEKMRANALSRNPMGRLTQPYDVGNFISLLCMDEASWVNGALLCVDGGEHIASISPQ